MNDQQSSQSLHSPADLGTPTPTERASGVVTPRGDGRGESGMVSTLASNNGIPTPPGKSGDMLLVPQNTNAHAKPFRTFSWGTTGLNCIACSVRLTRS